MPQPPKSNVHSKWECPQCNRTYASPLVGTKGVSHSHYGKAAKFVRVWQSKYDKIKD